MQCFHGFRVFAAATMGFQMDPFEVAEMQAILKANLIVPLDVIIFDYDQPETIKQKIQEKITIQKSLQLYDCFVEITQIKNRFDNTLIENFLGRTIAISNEQFYQIIENTKAIQ